MEYCYFERDPALCRASFAVNHPGQLKAAENTLWLDAKTLDHLYQSNPAIGTDMLQLIAARELRAINRAHPRWQELCHSSNRGAPFTVNLLACGDVGSTLLIGLKLLAQDTIKTIGIYDINPALCQRWEFELNQIAGPDSTTASPLVRVVDKDDLFNCDVFVFCATAGVPDLANKNDVRLAQYQRNAAIIKEYASLARAKNFRGLFAVVSDPVDLLCLTALQESNKGPNGTFDGRGLFPEQIEGYGLGVMHGRARYYAQKDPLYAAYLQEGRAYGPHGDGLIIANSIANYDDGISQKLTALAVSANIKARENGFKPYVAPALSSGALSLLATLRGQWHYSSTYLGGVFMGARNRRGLAGLETEILPLPDPLKQRITATTTLLLDMKTTIVEQ